MIGTAWRTAFRNPALLEKFLGLGVFVQFKLHEPEAELWLLGDGTIHEGAYAGASSTSSPPRRSRSTRPTAPS